MTTYTNDPVLIACFIVTGILLGISLRLLPKTKIADRFKKITWVVMAIFIAIVIFS